MPATYEPIASTTLGTAASSLTFDNIPGTYTDLVIVAHVKSVTAAGTTGGTARFNGDTGSNYSHTILYGTGSTAASTRIYGTNASRFRLMNDIPTGEYAIATIQVMSYANTNVNKTVLSSWADAGALVGRTVALWRSTSAVTSITLFGNDDGADNFATGSTFALYGIKAA